MNSFKSFCMMLVLVAIGYGVYRSLHLKNPQQMPAGIDQSIPQLELSMGTAPGALPDQANSLVPMTQSSVATSTGPTTLEPSTNPAPLPLANSTLGAAPSPMLLPNSTASEPNKSEQAPAAQSVASALIPDPANASQASNISPPPALPPLRPTTTDSNIATPTLPATSSPPNTALAMNQNPLAAMSGVTQTNNLVESNNSGALSPFQPVMREVQNLIEQRKLSEALSRLTKIYDDPKMTLAEQEQTLDLLNQLAGTVIYSREHRSSEPYRVQTGETLRQIAERQHVPWEMLAKINGYRNPNEVAPGDMLKVLNGPFRAEVNLSKKRVTLFLGEQFAGTFLLLNIGQDQPIQPGEYTVKQREYCPDYGSIQQVSADGQRIANPISPLGMFALDLGNGIKLHGHGAEVTPQDPRGTLRVSARDCEDLHDILSQGSQIIVRR